MHRIKILTISLAFFALNNAFGAVPSGQVVIINGLANNIGAGTSSTASNINVQVSDNTGPCSPSALVAFNGTLVVKWDSTKPHSTSQCTNINSIAVTPLKTTIGTVTSIIYDSTTATVVPALNATSAIHYTAPTTSVNDLVLLVTGTGVPSSAQSVSGTNWGIGAATIPVFNGSNGALMTVGIPGGLGLAGAKAVKLARQYGVLPHQDKEKLS